MKIHSRKTWGGKQPKPRTQQKKSQVREMFIHWPGDNPRSWDHIATMQDECQTMRGIQAFHMGPERRWSDFAYSFAVFPSGRIYRARGFGYVPAAQEGHNSGTIAVVVFLGPNDNVPTEVIKSLRYLKKYAEKTTGNDIVVRPHRSVTNTTCPGPRLTRIAKEL